MSVEKVEGTYIFVCDNCETEIDTGTSNFADALEEAKEYGIYPKKEGTVWRHYCKGSCYDD